MFRVGDKVVCIDVSNTELGKPVIGWLIHGAVYTISEIVKDSLERDHFLLEELRGKNPLAKRFVHEEDLHTPMTAPDMELDEIFEAQDIYHDVCNR